MPRPHSLTELSPILLTNYTGFPLSPGYPGGGETEFASPNFSSDQVFIA